MKALRLLLHYKIHHLLLWALLFLGWYSFRISDFPNQEVAWKTTAVKVAGLALLVYITNYLLIPGLLYKRRYIWFALVYLALIFGMGLLKIYINEKILLPFLHGINVFLDFKGRVYDNIIPSFLLTSTCAGAKVVFDYMTTQKKLSDISREKAETELKFLKSQINPHFLFNSLNSIYFLIDKRNTDARQTLLRFSDLLRYQLYECNADTIEIEKEITYLEDYIRLQQLRRDQNYEIEVSIGGDLHGFRIEPLLLIPFVENAFKHISHHNNGQRNFVRVELSKNKNVFHFIVENSRDGHQQSTEPEGGIGLVNTRRRLELLYPGEYKLKIDNNDTTFKVALQLDIKK